MESRAPPPSHPSSQPGGALTHYPIVRFSLNVEASGAAYPVELKQAVDPELIDRLAPGVTVAYGSIRRTTRKLSSTGASRFARPGRGWRRIGRAASHGHPVVIASARKEPYCLFCVGPFSSSV